MSYWYREAWESLWNTADDEEANMLDTLALRAGVFWQCAGCRFNNPNDIDTCDSCGALKGTATED
jgi:hypothetical protein